MKNVVVVNLKNNGTISSKTPVTLQNTPTGELAEKINRLDSLVDVNALGEENNATLVYESSSDTYVVKQLDLDGGTF